MLSCQDCEKYLAAFLDKALEVKANLDVQEHLLHCSPCADRAEGERTLHAFVSEHARVAPLPDEVKRRIVRQAMPAPARQSWWAHVRAVIRPWDFVMGMATAVVLLLLLTRPGFLAPFHDNMTQKLVHEAAMTYGAYTSQHVPLEIEAANDKVVVEWFNRRLGYTLPVPCITDKATKLRGGRLCRLFDRKSAALMYTRDGIDILLLAFKGGGLSLSAKPTIPAEGRTFSMQNIAGRPVAIWQRRGITYSLVGDLDRDALLQVAGTIHYR